MDEPLLVLRRSIIDNKHVTVDENDIIFEDGQRFLRKTPTILIQKSSSTPYSIDSIWFLIQKKDSSHGDYVKECVNEGFNQVTRADKNPIIKFMTGEIDDLSTYPGLTSVSSLDFSRDHSSLEKSESIPSQYKSLTQVMNEERFLHDRNSILTCPNKNFQILMVTVDNLNKKYKKNHTKAVNVNAPDAQRIVTDTTHSYNRYQFSKDQFWKDRMSQNLVDVQIADTEGTLTSIFSSDQNNGSKTNGDLEISQGQKRTRDDTHTPSKRSKSSRSKPKGNPIIIISGSSSSHINRNNAYSFFQNSVYESVDKNKSLDKGIRKIEITKIKNDGTEDKYDVIDNLMMVEDWDRVVAIFVVGYDWELKKIPFKGPSEIFHKIRGYYIKIDNDKLPDTIKNWNVKVLNLSTHKRHHDSSVLAEFWSDLDEFRKRNK